MKSYQTILTATQNAKNRAHQNFEKLKVTDNRFALFRLVTTLILLAVIFAYIKEINPLQGIFSFVLFLLYFSILSYLHKKISAKKTLWNHLELSYQSSLYRIERSLTQLKEITPEELNSDVQIPAGHTYAKDLDIPTSLFLFLNSCTTKQGAKELFKLLLSSTAEKLSAKGHQEETLKRSQMALALTKQTQLLRKFESLKFFDSVTNSNEFSTAEFTDNEFNSTEITSNANKNSSNTPGNLKSDKQNKSQHNLFANFFKYKAQIYAFLCLGLWIFTLIPAWYLFVHTQEIETVLKPITLYFLFLIFGSILFNDSTKKYEDLNHKIKLVSDIIEFMLPSRNKNHRRSLKLNYNHGQGQEYQYEFLKNENSLKINSYKTYVNLLNIRVNPIFWLVIHFFLPFDSILFLVIQWKAKHIIKIYPRIVHDLINFDIHASFARLYNEDTSMHFFAPNNETKNLANHDNNRSHHTSEQTKQIHILNMGHPLIPFDKRICNNLTLDPNCPVVLLTGSNMAGKSTFLRTIGANTALYNIGAPVCADTFSIPPLSILCAIRIEDSLNEGTSYFYAEVKRIKLILEKLNTSKEKFTSIFLIDEIFKGTNNKERLLGSTAILKALIQSHAFGFVSTHDLALCEISNETDKLKNMHFREHVEGGKLVFDYQIKDGPCPTTSALKIMQMEGLPVPSFNDF